MFNANLVFKSTGQRLNSKKIIGLDIETYGDDNKFYLLGLDSDGLQRVYYSKDDFIADLKTGIFNSSIFVATNLSFDFFGTFFGDGNIKDFDFIFRGSDLISAWTYVYNNRFNKKSDRNGSKIQFIDTMNYARMGVKKLGKIIGLPKLDTPSCLGRLPKDAKERQELETYNLRDCEISRKGLEFLYKSFEELGATPKMTIASTSMSLYKNKYLDTKYYRHSTKLLKEIFEGYYGGRTESFCRGQIKDYNYYDINSLYPSVMLNRYPDPNTVKTNNKNTIGYITRFDGVTDVLIECPYMEYPLLPYRTPDKLIFPTGTFRGTYTNIELREALKLGYKILKVYRNIYYTSYVYPFKEFVTDLYEKRKVYKQQNNPMEYVVKILMNSLYGKFGQKFDGRENLIPFNHTAEELSKYKKFEIVSKDFLKVTEDVDPPAFTIPIWCSYVTAYARLKLYEYIRLAQPIYVDTDSVITRREIATSDELGDMKLEMFIENGVIVKPKFYGFSDGTVKIKGVGTKVSFKDFGKLLLDPTITYTKFIKFKESLRRGISCNHIIDVAKTLDLNDTKREWQGDFDGTFQQSRPLEIFTRQKLKDLEMIRCKSKTSINSLKIVASLQN